MSEREPPSTARGADDQSAAPDASGPAADDETERVVLVNGVDVDKRYFYEVTKRMCRDWDLRKLSLLGPPVWALLSVVVAGTTLVLAVDGGLGAFVPAAEYVRTVPAVLRSLAEPTRLPLLLAAALALVVVGRLWLVPAAVANCRTVWRTVVGHASSVRAVAAWDPWQNLNYWHPFTSHLSDRDPLIAAAATLDAPISSVYADAPHYQNVFVDSVYVVPRGDLALPQRLAVAVFGWGRRRHVRRAAYAVGGGALLLLADRTVGATVVGPAAVLPTWLLVGLSSAFVAVLGLVIAAGRYPRVVFAFAADSAGLSRYSRLLNDADADTVATDGERVGLANSLSGYGTFFVSRLVAELFGDRQYDVAVDPSALVDDGAGFPASALDAHPGDEHAVAGATERLWSSVPAASLHEDPEDADVTLELAGVDYYTVSRRSDATLDRLRRRLGDDGTADDAPEYVAKRTAGERRGLRLPVKSFESVGHGLEASALESPPEPAELLRFDDGWDEDVLHAVFLGGGEHQQAISKLVLHLKAQGYDNVDVLENAFAAGDFDDDSGAEWSESVLFPTEYFVSFVGGASQFFRHEEHGFLLLRHELEPVDGQTRWAHVLVGMSAVGTKVGFLYWQYLYEHGFRDPASDLGAFEEDVVYFFSHPSPDAFTGPDDVGDLYMDASWGADGHPSFDVEPSDRYDAVEPRTATDDGTASHGRLGVAHYDLDITDDPTDA